MIKQSTLELAEGLQNSNIPEVAELSKALLALNFEYNELRNDYIVACAENVMEKHSEVFKRLREAGD